MNVQEIMESMSVHLNGDTTMPTAGGDEYMLWLSAMNQAQMGWADSDYDWRSLRKTTNTTLLMSQTSIAIPDTFVKFWGFPTVGGKQYPELNDEDTGLYESSSLYVSANLADRYIKINPALATTLAFSYSYRSRPTALATTTDRSACPSDNFLINSATSRVLLSRENPRYAEYRDLAQAELAQMIGTEVHTRNQQDSSIKNETMQINNFTLGVD